MKLSNAQGNQTLGGVNQEKTKSGYDAAVEVMKSRGVENTSGLLTQQEWAKRKKSAEKSGKTTEISVFNSYNDYVKNYVEWKTEEARPEAPIWGWL